MYQSKLLTQEAVYDMTWFWDEVAKFNAIANPNGVYIDNQLPIIKSELKEILDSTSEIEFLDGVIDSLVTLCPLVEREVFKVEYGVDDFRIVVPIHELESDINYFISSYKKGIYLESLVYKLTDVLLVEPMNFRTDNYIYNCQQVLDSNMSKFIPVELYRERYFAQVVESYPQHTVSKEIREYQGQEYVVFFNENGKILKGHSYYFDPQLIIEY